MNLCVFDEKFMGCFLTELKKVFGEDVDYAYILDDVGTNGFETAFEAAARQCGPQTTALWRQVQDLGWEQSDEVEAELVARFREYGIFP